MELLLETPIKLRIITDSDSDIRELSKVLQYKDKQIEMQIRNMKKNFYLRQRYGNEWVEDRINELNAQLYKKILFQDEKGYWTYSGLKKRLVKSFDATFKSSIQYPEYKLIPWHQQPKFEMYYYQKDAVDRMIDNPHCHVTLPTGSGKSLLLMNIIKRSGLKTLLIAPSSSIVDQLYDEAVILFGKKNVGLYSGSKKQFDKRIVVATAQSLVRVDEKSDAYESFSKFEAFVFDEAHTVPANTFEEVCHGLLKDVPYRWFTTATPERNDGKDLLLEGIIGECVYEKKISELQEEGYLAKISTMIIDVDTPAPGYTNSNMIKMNQTHLYNNPEIASIIANFVKQAVDNNMPTLVLIDEHDQEVLLKKYMSVQYEYARSGSDIGDIVERFNEGKLMCVVGTSAVSTGTNFLPVRLTICWQGNRAGTKVKQGPIGRSTRVHKASGKTSAKIIDFRLPDVPALARHANIRAKYYEEVGPVTYTNMKK